MNKFNSGTLRKREGYQSFTPSPINRPYHISDDIHYLVADASRLIGELNAYSKLVPDVDFFIRMHVTKEATESSRIEGTQTAFDEALMTENAIKPERRDDWIEVHNYTRAMNYAVSRLEKLPLSIRLLNETHGILMSGVRGKDKLPGEIRRSQNWIGGSSPSDAFFVPPHYEELGGLLSDLEKFFHNKELVISPLIKAAIGHYQFETIHPYCDGNGRIGRLLVTLYLVDQKILHRPTLYLSDFFARNKGAYYDSLTVVRHSHNIHQWIKFFLTGVVEIAEKSRRTFEGIIALRQLCEQKVLGLGGRAKSANSLLGFLYSNPITDAKYLEEKTGLTHPTINTLLKEFENLGILEEITGYERNRLFAFRDYLKLFR